MKRALVLLLVCVMMSLFAAGQAYAEDELQALQVESASPDFGVLESGEYPIPEADALPEDKPVPTETQDSDSGFDSEELPLAASEEPALAAGEYVIRAANGGCVLDVSGGSTDSGANVQIYSYNATDAQKWLVTCDEDGYYTIESKKSGKVLDLSGANVARGANIQQYSANDTMAQKWLLVASEDGFNIASALNGGFVLDVAGGSSASGTNVQLYKSNGTVAQRFVFMLVQNGSSGTVTYDTPLAEGDYVIQSGVGGQYVLDVAGGSSASGANVQIYAYNGTDAQKWSLAYDSQGYYTIASKKSGKVLDLASANAWYGSNIQQYKGNSTNAQKWIITQEGARFKIASAVDPFFVFDVSGGKAASGANVQAYFDNGTSAQRFSFIQLNPELPAGADIEDGVYSIAVASSQGYVLDVRGGSVENDANVQLYADNGTYAQRWGIIRNVSGLYSIFNMVSGKMLDVQGGSPLSGANVQQHTSNDTSAQLWSIVANGSDGSYTLLSSLSGMAVDVSGGTLASGSNIQVYVSNGTAAQSFVLVSKPLVEERPYAILTARNASLAVDVPSGSRSDGQALQVYSSNDSLAQHIVMKDAGDGSYTMQVVVSGKYLTAENGSVVQRSGASSTSQQWVASLAKGGVVFKNVATGQYMGVASASVRNGTALVAGATANANAMFCLRTCNLINDGLYTMISVASGSGRVLDVSGGSWSSGANAQLYAANGSNAQKFALKHVDGGYYKISMTLSGLALDVASGSKADGANVRFYTWNGTDAQLWEPMLVDGGFTFVNKGSGLLLGVAGGADKNGANVDQETATGSASQIWALASTSVNIGDMASMAKLVRAASGSGSVTASFSVGSSNWNRLMSALEDCWGYGYSVGFLLTDVQTGNYVALNADRTYYGASTMKGAYVTWIFEELLEPGYVSWGSIGDLITSTIEDSNNDTYATLRNMYGSDGFNSWLGGVGLEGWGGSWYDFYSPRELQLMWVRMLAYEQSGGAYVNTWRRTFDHSYYSMIYYELGDGKTTYSKPGWYPKNGVNDALDDSGIVIGSNGRRYLLTIMSDIDCWGGEWIERGIVYALDAIFEDSPRV